jgi:hypothetical protein
MSGYNSDRVNGFILIPKRDTHPYLELGPDKLISESAVHPNMDKFAFSYEFSDASIHSTHNLKMIATAAAPGSICPIERSCNQRDRP